MRVTDPKALDNARRSRPGPAYVDDVHEAVRDADVVLHLTEWKDFRALDPVELGTLVAHKRILDGRNVLDATAYVAAGWDLRALGRPHAGRASH